MGTSTPWAESSDSLQGAQKCVAGHKQKQLQQDAEVQGLVHLAWPPVSVLHRRALAL